MPDEPVSTWLKVAAFLRKGPRYIRTYAAWRARRALAARRDARGAWPRSEELPPLDSPAPGAGPAALCPWERRGQVVAAVPEELRGRTLAEADAVLEKRFRFRGREETFSGTIDWSLAPGGNRDWMWDLNRHHFLPVLGRAYWYTGRERFAEAFVDLVHDWMESSPPSVASDRWRSVFEVGVRVVNWCWADALFLPSATLDGARRQEILRGLLGMGRFLQRHIERHAWNNHLLLEARALAMLGILYPQMEGARAWVRTGTKLLEEQISRQVLPDGVHSERSSLYHEIIASEILEHVVVLRLAAARQPERGLEEQAERAFQALRLMAAFLREITRPDGSRPLLGDASRGDLHVRHDAVAGCAFLTGQIDALPPGPKAEPTLWLLSALGRVPGCRKPDAPAGEALAGESVEPEFLERRSAVFAEGGYAVLQSPATDARCGPHSFLHMVFDCGPFADPVVPGHGHADALSVDASVGESHVLVDPGMYSAHLGKRWRNYFRGTSAHNTLQVDGKDQSILAGLREVYRPAGTRILRWSTCPAFDVAAAEHTGYQRLAGRPVHRRLIFFQKPWYWLVADHVAGSGSHRFEWHHHLHPDQHPRFLPDSPRVVTRDSSGVGMAIFPLDGSRIEAEVLQGVGEGELVAGPPQGWVAFTSGAKEPAPVVRYRIQDGLPLTLATVLVPLSGEASGEPDVEILGVIGARPEPGGGEPAAARINWGGGLQESVLLGGVDPSRLESRRDAANRGEALRAGSFGSDALLATLRRGPGGEILAGTLVDGSRLLWRNREILRLGAGRVAPSGGMSFCLDGGRLEVWATEDLAGGDCSEVFLGLAEGIREVIVDGAPARYRKEREGVVVELSR